METVIEIVEADRRTPNIFRFNQNEITVGRAWSADLVIADEEIDGLHLRIRVHEDAERFEIEDLDTTNGVRLQGNKRLNQNTELNFGETISLGQTKIRIHRKYDPVPAAKPRSKLDGLLHILKKPAVAICLGLLAIWLTQFTSFLQNPNPIAWEKELSNGLIGGAVLLGWAVVWGMIAKLVKHQTSIWAHLGLASAILLVGYFLDGISAFISFNTLSIALKSFLEMLNVWIQIFLWVSVALVITTKLQLKARLATVFSVLALSVLTSYLLPKFNENESVVVIPLLNKSLPTSFQVSQRKPEDHFSAMVSASLNESSAAAERQREKNRTN